MFLRAVGGIRTVDEARVPLASLFLWVQVLHAFDVPRRRDLSFSVVSSTTLVAAGGAIALSGDVRLDRRRVGGAGRRMALALRGAAAR